LSNWEAEATTDPTIIRSWFAKWPRLNLGIAPGKSGLVMVDHDSYKENYAGADLICREDEQTATQLSQSGGAHLFFKKPEGKTYTNANNTLPAGVDIRCDGGMVVVYPSIGPSGRQYQWEDGYSLFDIEPRPLPQALVALLDEAQAKSTPAKAVTFTTPTTEAPQLGQWHLSKEVKSLIFTPAQRGQRSEADMKVVTSLCYAGATDNDILAVFEHCPIGISGKFAEAGRGYLARTIGRARGYVEANPRPNAPATVALLRLWIKTHDIAAYVPAGPGRRCLRKVVDAWCDLAEKDERLIVNAGKKLLAKLAGVDAKSVKNALALLDGVLFDVTPGEHGARIALVESCRLQQLHPALSVVTGEYKRGEVAANDKNAYSPHKADDAFATGVSRFVKTTIRDVAQATEQTYKAALNDYTKPGLGEGVLLAYDTSLRLGGHITAQEYAAEAGIKLSSARAHLRRCEVIGLATTEREGSRGPKVYSFVPDFWPKIDDMTPQLRTYKLSAQREAKRIEGAQQWAKAEQEKAKDAGDVEQVTQLERRFNHLAQARIAHLKSLHPDLSAKEIERLAYEVAAYKRSPEKEAAVKTARQRAHDEHALTVACIIQCLTNYANQTGRLPEMPTGDVNVITIEGQTFECAMVAEVLRNPALVKRTMQGVEEVYATVSA
jgi:DNA-binding transcriptional ArsR family regulator